MNYKTVIEVITVHSAYVIPGILSAAAAGSIAYVIWLFFLRRTAKFRVVYSIVWIKFCFFCYLVPLIPFALLQVREWTGMAEGREMLISTNVLGIVLAVAVVLWMMMTMLILVYRCMHYHIKRSLCYDNVPVTDKEILEMVDNWKKVLGIRKGVTVYYNKNMSSPALLYHKGYQILLPELSMTREELNIVLLHELMHLKCGDIRLKNVAFVVNAIHSFNPITYRLRSELTIWEEVSCDRACCKVGRGIFTDKEYFNTIIELKKQSQEEKNALDTICCLSEEIKLLQFRIDVSKAMKGDKRRMRAAEALIIVLLSVLLISFSSEAMVKGFAFLVDRTLKTEEVNSVLPGDFREATVDSLFGTGDIAVCQKNIADCTEGIKLILEPEEIMVFALPWNEEMISCIGIADEDACFQFGFIDDKDRVFWVEAGAELNARCLIKDNRFKMIFIHNLKKDRSKLELFVQFNDT